MNAEPQKQDSTDGRTDSAAALALPTEVSKVIEKLPDQEAKGLLSIFLARSTTTFGPDAETAKILSEAEIHEEECRLKAYQAALQNRETQSQRDHDYRKKRLNHQTSLSAIVLLVTVGGVIAGLGLSATGNSTIGNPVLIASFTLLSSLAGKLLTGREKE
jgi:hypothetical protein